MTQAHLEHAAWAAQVAEWLTAVNTSMSFYETLKRSIAALQAASHRVAVIQSRIGYLTLSVSPVLPIAQSLMSQESQSLRVKKLVSDIAAQEQVLVDCRKDLLTTSQCPTCGTPLSSTLDHFVEGLHG